WNRAKPVSSTTLGGYFKKATASAVMATFNIKTPKTTNKIIPEFSIKKLTSRSIPMEIKKKLVNNSLNGRIILVAWWLYSDSDTISPARKAPNARDNPASEVRKATAK